MTLKDTSNGSAGIARLETLFKFKVLWEPTGQYGFLAELTDQQILGIRCDPSVAFLEWSVVVSTGDRSPALSRR